MTTRRNDFHGQTIGSGVTAGSSAASGDPFTLVSVTGTGTMTYVADPASGGRTAIHCAPQSGQSCFARDASFASTQLSISDCFYYATAPTAEMPVFQVFDAASNNIAILMIRTNGIPRLRNATGAFIADGTVALVPGHWYRIESQIFSDATAGTFDCQWYIDDGTAQTGSVSGSAVNTRGGNIASVARGPSAAYSAAATDWYYTNLQAQDGTLSPLGPFPEAPPAVATGPYISVGPNNLVHHDPYLWVNGAWQPITN